MIATVAAAASVPSSLTSITESLDKESPFICKALLLETFSSYLVILPPLSIYVTHAVYLLKYEYFTFQYVILQVHLYLNSVGDTKRLS